MKYKESLRTLIGMLKRFSRFCCIESIYIFALSVKNNPD